jgi:membrane protein insertase Oxa1/YidC/SpoIIIJ
MAIYWFLSGIIALIQTLIMQKVAEKQKAKAKFAKYTTK